MPHDILQDINNFEEHQSTPSTYTTKGRLHMSRSANSLMAVTTKKQGQGARGVPLPLPTRLRRGFRSTSAVPVREGRHCRSHGNRGSGKAVRSLSGGDADGCLSQGSPVPSTSAAFSESDLLDVMAINLTLQHPERQRGAEIGGRDSPSLSSRSSSKSSSSSTVPETILARTPSSGGDQRMVASITPPPPLLPPQSDRTTRKKKILMKEMRRSRSTGTPSIVNKSGSAEKGTGTTDVNCIKKSFLPPRSPSRNSSGRKRSVAKVMTTSHGEAEEQDNEFFPPCDNFLERVDEPWPHDFRNAAIQNDWEINDDFNFTNSDRSDGNGSGTFDKDGWPEEHFDSPFGLSSRTNEESNSPTESKHKEKQGTVHSMAEDCDNDLSGVSILEEEACYDPGERDDVVGDLFTPQKRGGNEKSVSIHGSGVGSLGVGVREHSPASVTSTTVFEFNEPTTVTLPATANGNRNKWFSPPRGSSGNNYAQQQPNSSGTLSLSSSDASSVASSPARFSLEQRQVIIAEKGSNCVTSNDKVQNSDECREENEDEETVIVDPPKSFGGPRNNAIRFHEHGNGFEPIADSKQEYRFAETEGVMWEPWDTESVVSSSTKASSSTMGSF